MKKDYIYITIILILSIFLFFKKTKETSNHSETDSLKVQITKDSLMLKAYETQHEEKLDSIDTLSFDQLYYIWSGKRYNEYDTASSNN